MLPIDIFQKLYSRSFYDIIYTQNRIILYDTVTAQLLQSFKGLILSVPQFKVLSY